MKPAWTTVGDLRGKMAKLWDRGAMLAVCAGAEDIFPLTIRLKGPSAPERAERFAEVREWAMGLKSEAGKGGFSLVNRSVNDRVLGRNDIPQEVVFASLEDGARFIGKAGELARFRKVVEETRQRRPEVMSYVAARSTSVLALALEDAWTGILTVADYMIEHPRPGIYLRQLDLPGIDTKFVERHKGVLSAVLDLVLPDTAIDREQTGASRFCERYGFLSKPELVRFRFLDKNLDNQFGEYLDVTLRADDFARLAPVAANAIITENEINFLSLPSIPRTIAIFGAGYGFSALANAHWLHDMEIFYWGDLDTHGFAILNELRLHFPHTMSLLMDEETLLAHRKLWVREAKPSTRTLERLTEEEARVYEGLRNNTWGENVRLEQERIGFETVEKALELLNPFS